MTDQPTPAIILCDPVIGSLEVGALSILDRLVVTLHRAGCFPIRVICNGTLPSLRRSRALGIRPDLVDEIPALDRTTLVARCELVVQMSDVRRILQDSSRLTRTAGAPFAHEPGTAAFQPPENPACCPGFSRSGAPKPPEGGTTNPRRFMGREPRMTQPWQLTARTGDLLPIGFVSPETAAAICEPNDLKDSSRAGELGPNPESDGLLRSADPIRAEGIAALVVDSISAWRAERMLWNSLASDSDGMVDVYFNRPAGRILSKFIIHTSITPNQVSLGSILIGLAGAYCFCKGQHTWSVWGAVLFQISAIVDCVDGDVARMVFKESPVGKWLDLVGDQVVHIAVFAGIALGAWQMGLGSAAWILGASAITGAFLSFWVVLRGMRLPKDPDRARQQQFVDKATSRDFSVLVLTLACLDKLPWFLWVTAIGVHVFWITALWLQLPGGRPAK